MKEIKTISCHGTSYTEGGGFEWNLKDKTKHLDEIYSELPKTQFNYSWPGQLQKLVKYKVTNYGKSGYGNKKVYRDVHNIFKNEDTSKHLFLIELSQLGRDELFISKFNDYCVINYDIRNEVMELDGYAFNYFDQKNHITKYLDSHNEFFKKYIEITKNLRNVFDEIEKNLDFLVSFLEYNNLNYYFVNTPLALLNIKPKNSKIIKYPSGNKKRILTDFVDYIRENQLTIRDVTNGVVDDPHFSLEGNVSIAKEIYEQLKENYKL